MPSDTPLLLRASRNIPSKLKPPLAVILNLGLSTLLGYLAAPWIKSDLAAIGRPLDAPADFSSLIAWRVVEVLGYWIGGWDATQAASLSMLSLAPGLHYFNTYHPSHAPLFPTLAASTIIDLAAVYLPLRFLRPESNRRSASDSTRVTAALLTALLYQLVLQVAAAKFLSAWLLGVGWELESVVGVHSTSEALMLTRAAMMLPIGWAATEIIFFSDGEVEEEGAEEDLGGLLRLVWGLWRKLGPKTRRVVKRTVLVATYQAAGATAGVAGTVKGGELRGAAGLSAVWVVATVVVGTVLGWVGEI